MTTSNEHNNAPAVPSGLLQKLDASIAWLERGEVLPGTPACIGLDDIKVIRALLAATPAPAPAPAQEFNKSVADAEIKAMYVESQGSDKGWLGIEGSYFIGGVVAARKQKAASAPAQERCSTCGYLTSEREHLGCLRRAVKDLDIATGGPYDAQGVGLTDEEIEAIAKKHMSTVGDHWCNEEAIRESHAEDFARDIISALRAKESK